MCMYGFIIHETIHAQPAGTCVYVRVRTHITMTQQR